MTALVLQPGSATLADWRAIYRGALPSLDEACRPVIERSARVIAQIVAKGEPVYGINTGFGKLASVRIDSADLAKLQRNIVLSHAAGVGSPTPAACDSTMLVCSCARSAAAMRTLASLPKPVLMP